MSDFKSGDKLIAISGKHCGKEVTFGRYNIYNKDIFYTTGENYDGRIYHTEDFIYNTPLILALT
jgi:hypothetical protein